VPTFGAVAVPQGEDGGGLLQLLGQAAGLAAAAAAVSEHQVAGHLGVVLELGAEGAGHHARAPPLPGRQEGELGRHVDVQPHVGRVLQPLVPLRQQPVYRGGQQVS